ncbi:MAG: Dickkopf N-terminal cysteine-rich domain-containing protein [Sandaracinaceae bacterium]
MIARVALTALLLCACDRPPPVMGSGCALNSDCAEPLICRLELCRRQCVASRDCGAGLLCLGIGEEEGGACQLPEERSCLLTSDCTPGLECNFGTCTTVCVEDRDCSPGAQCLTDPDTEALACIEPQTDGCIYNSDCPEGFVCGADQTCRIECREDRDCDAPRRCVESFCVLSDAGG